VADFAATTRRRDALIVSRLGDKTVTIKRNSAAIATDIKAIFDSELQDVDASGLIQALRPGFTINKADLSKSTLEERDEIIDGNRTWRVLRVLYEDASMITVLVG
jgi:hypothetical protein